MPDDHARPFDGLAQWLGDDPGDRATPDDRAGRPPDDEHPRRSSSRRSIRAAALAAPWLVVLAVLLAPGGRDTAPQHAGPPTVQDGPTAPDAPSAVADAAPAGEGSPEPAPLPASEVAATSSVPAGIAAAAVRLVRDAVTGRHANVSAAVDVAVPEPPRPLGAHQWMVRVQTVVLRGDARRWRSATHEIWAVPVGVRAGRSIGLDRPWRVATEDPTITQVRWSAAAVDEPAVRSALRMIGARPARDLGAQQHPTMTHIIRVRVVDGEQTGYVWLTTHPAMRVLGAPATAAAPAERTTP